MKRAGILKFRKKEKNGQRKRKRLPFARKVVVDPQRKKKLPFAIRRKKSKYPFKFQLLIRPGLVLEDAQLLHLIDKVKNCSATAFNELPDYQVLTGRREEFDDKVLAIAWRPDGEIAGYCSCVLLPVPGVGHVLHLGLTVVRPEDRGLGLTHFLTRKAVTGYIMRHRPVGRLWCSNCAAVLSSLGNVALHFDKVYPSPFEPTIPSKKHQKIAETIDHYYREKMYIREDAVFDRERFIFRGSVRETVFQKDADDRRYYHRRGLINEYYKSVMDFTQGDEVLQIGYCSVISSFKHKIRIRKQTKALKAAS